MEDVSRREWLVTAGAGVAAVGLGMKTARGETPAPDDMVVIPAGSFLMGTPRRQAEALAQQHGLHPSWLSGEWPRRRVALPSFGIDRYPITNRQYLAFCEPTDRGARKASAPQVLPAHWQNGAPAEIILDHPVTYVNRDDARAYAAWAGKRLPTEAEWEKAARGPEGRLFPWGDDFDPEACQWNRDDTGAGPGTAPVTSHPQGASPYGVMDMAGNAAEWCADGPGRGSAFIKGGCFLTTRSIHLRPAARNMSGFDNNRSKFYGFRCVKDVAS